MDNTVKERLLLFLKYKNTSQGKFEKAVGFSNGYINNIKSSFSPAKIEKIIGKYPELNRDWLITGEGEMLKGDTTNNQISPLSHHQYCIPLLPISAQGGSLNDFIVSVKGSDCEMVISPIKGADYAMPVAGESMSPEYPSGSQIIIKKINERAFIDWGKVYVLDTCNGIVIKKLMPANESKKIKCVSINPDYPPFEMDLDDVFGVYRVLLCMSLK